MKIVVLGAGGFVGKHLCERLIKDGHQVFGENRTFRSSSFAGAQVVVNCAGQLDNPSTMTADNLLYPLAILNFILDNNLDCRFIQIGSSAEIGRVEGDRFENTACNPSNLYEATKLAATNLCVGYAKQYDLDVVVARPFSLYGSADKPRKMLPTLYRCFKEGKQFVVYEGGHDWIYIDDFVEGIISLIAARKDMVKGEVFNFGTGICTSNQIFVGQFKHHPLVDGNIAVSGKKEKYHPYDVTIWRANIDKARSKLGWSPKITVEQGIDRFIREQE